MQSRVVALCLVALCVAVAVQGVDVHRVSREANTLQMKAGPQCQKTEELTESSGEFSDGSKEGATYENDMKVCYKLPAGKEVRVRFVRVDIEKGYDFLTVWHKGSRKSGKSVTTGEEFTGKDLVVFFDTDYSVVKTGFTAEYEVLGGGDDDNNSGSESSEPFSVDINREANLKECKTTRYEATGALAVRRGCTVEFTVKGGSIKNLKLKEYGRGASRTGVAIYPGQEKKGYKLEKDGETYKLSFPKDGPIGYYTLEARSNKGKTQNLGTVYVLYNPHSASSPVHMSESDLKEYLNAESGPIWVGSSNDYSTRQWAYDQFVSTNVETVLRTIIGRLDISKRGDPVEVSRHLSTELANNVCHGKWGEPYDNGKKPWEWTGSTDILTKYAETNQAVRYCQCWVFAGVLNTAARAIGQPSRVVTNFDSAHEASSNKAPHYDQVVEEWYTVEDGNYKRDSSKSGDSIWNFHVWNEFIMKRPDVDLDETVWNQVDGTPQEYSFDDSRPHRYVMGPAPIPKMYDASVKGKLCSTKYDSDFGCGETNADVKRYRRTSPSGKYEWFQTAKHHVGHLTATMTAKGGRNVAGHYKKEGNKEFERPSFLEEAEDSVTFETFLPGVKKTIDAEGDAISAETESSTVRVGSDFTARLRYQSNKKKGSKGIKLVANIKIEGILYNGKRIGSGPLKVCKGEDSAIASRNKVLQCKLTFDEYKQILTESSTFRITFSSVAQDGEKDSGAEFFQVRTYTLRSPKLGMLGRTGEKSTLRVGHKIGANIMFTNPLPIKLTGVSLRAHLAGGGFDHNLVITKDGKEGGEIVIGPKEKKSFSIFVKSSSPGEHKLIATLASNELANAFGSMTISVDPAESDDKSAQETDKEKEEEEESEEEDKTKKDEESEEEDKPKKKKAWHHRVVDWFKSKFGGKK